jgi:hypothetical protein
VSGRGAHRGLRATRRSFLRLAGGAAAFAVLADVRALPAAAEAVASGAADATRFFDPAGREILTRIVERMVDTGDPSAPALADTRTLDTIDTLCASLDPAATAPLPVLLRLVEWGPLIFDLRFARFSELDAAGRDAHLAGWMNSRFGWRRMAFYALRNLAFLGWWSQDATWPLIDYRGPLLRGDATARP